MAASSTAASVPGWPDEFATILGRHLPYAEPGDLATGRTLTELGLDSMATINLLLEIEEHFAVEFDDALLTPETFATADTLWQATSALCEPPTSG